MVGTIRKNYIIACMCMVAPLFAGSDEELFLRGNKYYAEQKYDDAYACYSAIGKKGRAVLYNIGNCLFNTQDCSGALVYWSRAQEGATAAEYNIIMHNKDLAFAQLGKQKEVSWWHKIIIFLRSQLPYISLLFLQLIFLLCWWIFMIVLYTVQHIRFKKIFQAFLLLYMVVMGTLLTHQYVQSNTVAAIVVKRDAHLFAGPDKGFHVISSVEYADNAHVKETREGWYKVQYADMIGWVEADVIQII